MPDVRYGARSLVPDSPDAPAPAQPEMWAKTLVTWYETDPEVIAAVLPPPLEPASEPLVRVNIAEVQMAPQYMLGASVFSVKCTHEGTEGLYDLTMVMTTEAAVLGGRETFGEPKKLGQVTLEQDGARVTGKVTRNGITYLEVQGDIAEELTPKPKSGRVTFYFKFLLDPEGKGFDSEP